MGYVVPNSTVELFKGINLDNRYLDTIFFTNEAEQNAWFSNKVFKSFREVSFQRENSETIKVGANATELYGTTYMRFKNTRTGSKWFYAFVLACEYVSEEVTEISYEIDVMQTWFIQNGYLSACMVLREHTKDDTYFTNLEPEPIGCDSYTYDYLKVFDESGHPYLFDDYSVVVNTTGKPYQGYNYQDGLYIGTKYDHAQCNSDSDASGVDTMLENLIGDWDEGQQLEEVIELYTVPTFLATGSGLRQRQTMIPIHRQTSYTPKNHKLKNYPFSYLYCTTHNGDSNLYKWELFGGMDTSSPDAYAYFELYGTGLGGGQIMCYPYDYAGMDINYSASVIMDDFPKNAFTYDAYQAWVASGGRTKLQNEDKIVTARGITNISASASNFINTTINSANKIYGSVNNVSSTGRHIARRTGQQVADVSSSINDVVQSGAGLANSIINYKEAKYKIDYQWKDAHYIPNEAVGANVPNIMVGRKKLNYYFYNVHVVDSEMKRLDDFLSCFGYATNKVKVPNLTGRRYWNFVQTKNCVVRGDMPASSKEAIGRIFDGGITFWHNGDQVGNYSQSVSDGSINNPIWLG